MSECRFVSPCGTPALLTGCGALAQLLQLLQGAMSDRDRADFGDFGTC